MKTEVKWLWSMANLKGEHKDAKIKFMLEGHNNFG